MIHNNNYHTAEIASTIGGTVLSASSIPEGSSFVSTILLAMTGAITSFLVTILVKRIWKKITKKEN